VSIVRTRLQRPGDGDASGLRPHLQHAQPAGTFVGVRGHVSDIRVDGAVLPAFDLAVQTNQAPARQGGGSALRR
jgi:hypothetical protein